MNNKVYIFGYGDVGKAITKCVEEAGYDYLIDDLKKGYSIIPNKEEEFEHPIAMHICFPYSETFTTEVLMLIAIHKPRLVIIDSTVPPEVFYILFKSESPIVHSPVRGSHPNLFEDLHKMVKFVSNEHPNLCSEYYFKWKIPYNIRGTAEELAAGKIFSVNWYGMEVAFSQMIKNYCEEMELDFNIVYNSFQRTTNIGRYYIWNEEKKRAVSKHNIPRPTMYPGKIGGHCVMQDIKLARNHEIGNWKLWDWIEEENDRTI